jgi:probable rRNA maturation factor
MSPSDPDIRFFRLPKNIDPLQLVRFAAELRKRVIRGRDFSCLVTTDRELQKLNRRFRSKDYATDVLSFPAEDTPGGNGAYLGDLAISWQRASAQAAEFGHSVENELRVLMLHGVLHLSGLDHETDRGQMARAETRWRKVLSLPVGLIERVRA